MERIFKKLYKDAKLFLVCCCCRCYCFCLLKGKKNGVLYVKYWKRNWNGLNGIWAGQNDRNKSNDFNFEEIWLRKKRVKGPIFRLFEFLNWVGITKLTSLPSTLRYIWAFMYAWVCWCWSCTLLSSLFEINACLDLSRYNHTRDSSSLSNWMVLILQILARNLLLGILARPLWPSN